MWLEVWEILAVNADSHQGQPLHKQVASEQRCSFEANPVVNPTCCTLA